MACQDFAEHFYGAHPQAPHALPQCFANLDRVWGYEVDCATGQGRRLEEWDAAAGAIIDHDVPLGGFEAAADAAGAVKRDGDDEEGARSTSAPLQHEWSRGRKWAWVHLDFKHADTAAWLNARAGAKATKQLVVGRLTASRESSTPRVAVGTVGRLRVPLVTLFCRTLNFNPDSRRLDTVLLRLRLTPSALMTMRDRKVALTNLPQLQAQPVKILRDHCCCVD